MPKMKDPYLAGWNEAIEAAAREADMQERGLRQYNEHHAATAIGEVADAIRSLSKEATE
jgi:hypothetical protein